MNDYFLKSVYKSQNKQTQNERNSFSLTQYSPLNKTLINTSNISGLSTNLNSSESLLFNSLFINSNIINFQKRKIKIKNKIFSSSFKDIDKNFYQKYIQNKLTNNIRKINLPKTNSKKENFSPLPEIKNPLKINNNDNSLNMHSCSTARNNNEITKISFIETKLRDELLDMLNFKSNRLGCNNYNNKYFFKESILKRVLIKKYIHEQKNKYSKEIKNYKIYKHKINEKEKKIKNIHELVSKNKFNILMNYNLFLQKKIKNMKEKDFDYYKKIQLLKTEVKNLFIKIKIESDKLWYLFDIRNFLICVKESISIKKLPLIFRLYNSEYLDELTKINENDIYILEKMEKPKKNMNLFRIPTNLVVYINALNGLNKESIDKRYIKYLDCNYIIFNNVEEFIEKYIMTEKDMLNHLRNSLLENNYNQFQKIKLMKQINAMEKENKIFENDYNRVKMFYDKEKNKNEYYNKRKMDLSSFKTKQKEEKSEGMEEKEIEYKKFLESEKEFKNNENFLKILQKKYNIEKNQFLLKYNELKNNKKFETEKEYVYYFIYQNIIQLFKIYPEYFYKQNKFSLRTMHTYINNIKNCHKFPDVIIQMNVLYLLSIYESAIINFLLDYQKDLDNFGSTNFYHKIKKKVIINKKSIIFKQQNILENKVKKMKFEKYNKKQTRYRYRQRNVIINDSLKFKKANSLNNKSIKQKESFSEEKNLLSY